eukprot:s3743_g1.t1
MWPQHGLDANKQVVEAPASTFATGNGIFIAKPDSSGRGSGGEQHQVRCEGQGSSSSIGPRPKDLSLLACQTWKLRHKALGSNGAEVQAVLEVENWNFRARLLCCAIHGAGLCRPPDPNKVEFAEEMIKQVEGILAFALTAKVELTQCSATRVLQL